MKKKITIKDIIKKKSKEKITSITAYDYPTAKIVDLVGFDIVLVGDSVGMVVGGEPTTLGVSMEIMEYHTKIVRKAIERAFLVSDMPFGSFQVSIEEGVSNAIKLVASGAEAVKIEGVSGIEKTIEKIIKVGIPVMGHVGLTPQSVNIFGGYRKVGKNEKERKKLIEDSKKLESLGVFSIVLENIPEEVAKEITESVSIPTIGIGSGKYCDGQILVFHDVLGLTFGIEPPFSKKYANLKEVIKSALEKFKSEIEKGVFPE